jgi:3-keto-disaccharide hydrolase
MRHLFRDLIIFTMALPVGLFATSGILDMRHSPTRGLPYRDDFANANATGWVAYDGNWTVQSGVMVNESNERGAKLITGSPYWADYAVDADLALSNTGEAGIIARVSHAESGVDSYDGIYVGLRVRDESLVVGEADYGWGELAVQPLPQPIIANVWYHIHLEMRGCDLKVLTWRDGNEDTIRLSRLLSPCLRRGKIGLRSYDSGGQWKNIRVTALRAGNGTGLG